MESLPENSLREAIRAAFPPERFSGQVTSCDCGECHDLTKELRNKRWDEIPGTFVDLTASPVLLTREALVAFVPAFMVRALDMLAEPGNIVAEFTVYSLSPHSSDSDGPNDYQEKRLHECASMMTGQQILAIRSFPQYVGTNSPDAEGLREFIGPALVSVWKVPRDISISE